MFLFIAIIIVLYTNNNAICIMHQSTFELNAIKNGSIPGLGREKN